MRPLATILFVGVASATLFAQHVTVPPYVQLGVDDQSHAAKSLTIVWHGSAPGKWSVRFRTESGRAAEVTATDDPVRVKGIANHEVLSATIGGLKAGEAIKYSVHVGGEVVAKGATRAPKNGPIRVAVMGDCGRNSKGQRLVAGVIRDQKPDMTLIVGDIVYPNGRMSEYGPNFYAMMNSAKYPLMQGTLTVAATGNHDTAYRNLTKYPDGLGYYAYWRQPLNGPEVKFPVKGSAQALLAAAGGVTDRRANFAFDNGPVHWVILDSNTYADWKRTDLRRWLADNLKNTRKPWTMVAFHHIPFHSSKKHAGDTMMRAVADLFTKYKVDLVLAGHVHNYQRTYPIHFQSNGFVIDKSFDGVRVLQPKGTIYVCTGAGGGELYDQKLADDSAKWLPFTAVYKAGFGASFLDISARTLTLTHLDSAGHEKDRIRIEK